MNSYVPLWFSKTKCSVYHGQYEFFVVEIKGFPVGVGGMTDSLLSINSSIMIFSAMQFMHFIDRTIK